MPTYGVSSSYVRQAGIGNAASYQVSGRPYLTGNLDIDNGVEDKIVFPAVTKRIVIQNICYHALNIGQWNILLFYITDDKRQVRY